MPAGFFRWVIVGCGLVLCVGGLAAAGPDPLRNAIGKVQAESDRWAYTQIQVMKDADGRVTGERIVRVDPSQPFAQRRLLLSVDGREPGAKERRSFQEERESDRLRREREGWQGRTIVDRINLDEAKIEKESGGLTVYQVPLVPGRENRYPAEKFQLLITVDAAREEITEVSLRLRQHIRAALVARIDRGELTARFRTIEPDYPAAVTELQVAGSGTILFFRVGVGREERRFDFRRVTPWDERFSVEFGELEFLGF